MFNISGILVIHNILLLLLLNDDTLPKLHIMSSHRKRRRGGIAGEAEVITPFLEVIHKMQIKS